MPNSLQDKVVLITGASSGIGADAARLFAREGSIVVMTARRVDRLAGLEREIGQAGGRAFNIPLDMTVQSQINHIVKTVLEKQGRIDILINNAGMGRLNWLEKLDPSTAIDTPIDVNLRGVIQLTRAVLPSMLARRTGQIINICSVAGLIAAPMYSVYSATKYGLRGFTDALRREVGPLGIHVSGLYPGPAKTEFGLQAGENPLKQVFQVPGWINMSSEYVARQVVRLAHRPRRSLVIPWWFSPVFAFDAFLPGLVDWILKVVYVKRFHQS